MSKAPYYTGPLVRKMMGIVEAQAYLAYRNQRQRCYNPNNLSFPNYGAKGIKVEYGPREFVGWWLARIKDANIKGRVCCGRIDHTGNYNFENIKLESIHDNTVEMILRTRRKSVLVFDREGVLIERFESLVDAAKHFKVFATTIKLWIKEPNLSRRKRPEGLVFKHE